MRLELPDPFEQNRAEHRHAKAQPEAFVPDPILETRRERLLLTVTYHLGALCPADGRARPLMQYRVRFGRRVRFLPALVRP